MWRPFIVLTCLLTGCGSLRTPQWYRGNTHAHTVICGHADSTPEDVARWYLDHGYHFLVLSEHNHFIDPGEVALPMERRDDFILIPGEEVTGHKTVHATALNIHELVDWSFEHEQISEVIQNHVDGTIKAGGTTILNHPNYKYAVSAEDILPVKRLHLFELYNGHPLVNNDGDQQHASTEQIWDTLLTAGMVIYAVASDDAHQFQTWAAQKSNPGRGWVMVQAKTLSPDSITEAIQRGDFYASSGVVLKRVRRGGGRYEIVVDEEATIRLLESESLAGRSAIGGEEGFVIEWIGQGGKVLATNRGTHDCFRIPSDQAYVRAKITFIRHAAVGGQAYFAWTQPVFTDNRGE